MSNIRGEAADIGIVVVSVGVAALLSIAYNALVGRMLGPAAYSDFAGGIALATLLAVALGALTPITAHLAASYAATGHDAKIRGLAVRLFRAVLIIGVIVGAIAAAVAVPVSRLLQFSSALVVPAAVAVFLAMATGNVIRAALRGAQKYTAYGVSVMAEAGLRLGVGVALLLWTRSPVAALLAYAVATVAVMPPTAGAVRRLSPASESVQWPEVTAMLSTMTLLVAAMAVYGNDDLILVKRFFNREEAGIYGAAATLARAMVVIIIPLEALLIPRLTFLIGRREEVRPRMARLVSAGGGMAVSVLLTFALAPTRIVTLLYGRSFAAAGGLLPALAGSVLAICFAYLVGQVLVSMRRPRAVAFFVAGVIIEVALLFTIARSLRAVVLILVATRISTLLAMLGAVWLARDHAERASS